MGARHRSWWQKIRKLLAIAGIIAVCALGVALIAGIIGGYLLNWDWTGLNAHNEISTATEVTLSPQKKVTTTTLNQSGKTLWDWLNLLGVLAIPAVVGLGAAWYTAQQGKVSDRENTDNQRETALQA